MEEKSMIDWLTTVVIIAKGATEEEALEFARTHYAFTWDSLKKAEWDNDCWIGMMSKADYSWIQAAGFINK